MEKYMDCFGRVTESDSEQNFQPYSCQGKNNGLELSEEA